MPEQSPIGTRPPSLLFTAFEPSGDDHASAVIAELRGRYPDLVMHAWGGPKMRNAGAVVVEATGEHAVMGVPGIQKILEHTKINQRIDEWLAKNPTTLHVPVDSPAANGPICEIAKKHGCKVVHLVAPQIWAWGRWRIHKLRRMTDLVLCMFPFEVRFFGDRRVPAKFIGHFLFDKELDSSALAARSAGFGSGTPKIAMMPGSRPHELEVHFPVLLDVFEQLQRVYPGISGVVAATTGRVAENLRKVGEARVGGWPKNLTIVTTDTDAVVHWCDLAIVKSGTVTLQVAKQLKPMVVFYRRSNPVLFLIARAFLSTKVFSLPNVLAHKRIIPELIPHFGGAGPIVKNVLKVLRSPELMQKQRDDLAEVTRPLRGLHAASAAADAIEEVIGLRRDAKT